MTISIEIMIESPNIGRRSRFFAVLAFYTLHFLKFADFDPAFFERSDGLFADVSVGGSANECLRSDRSGRGNGGDFAGVGYDDRLPRLADLGKRVRVSSPSMIVGPRAA